MTFYVHMLTIAIRGQACLGQLYFDGKIVKQDNALAAQWLRKAEEGVRAGRGGQPARDTMTSLARLYSAGRGGLPQDRSKAEELIVLARPVTVSIPAPIPDAKAAATRTEG